MASKKNIIDSIRNLATKFSVTDETRLDETWLSYAIDNVAAELKIKQYLQTGILDQTWLSDLGMVTLHKVNISDDINVTFCNCDVSKVYLPQTISFISKEGNIDLGMYAVISACGTKQYYPKRLSMWRYTPTEHTNNLFKYYWRINSAMYVNDKIEKLRIIACLLHPEDGKYIQSEPIASGSIVSGTTYVVKFGQIVYNATVYAENSTFVGTATTTFTGSGKVYLNSQAIDYRETDDYPASGEMIRAIEIEILTKELGIERQAVVDVRNDSKDDTQKGAQ
jgi:hypothetical protein